MHSSGSSRDKRQLSHGLFRSSILLIKLASTTNNFIILYQKQPLDDTPATSISSNSQSLHSAIKRTAPVELWDDIKYPNYKENPFEFEAINRISNYTYEEPRRYNYWHYLYNSMDWFDKCDSTKSRRGGSIVFVVAIVVLGAVLIGLAIPNEGSVATHGDSSNSTSPATPKHKPVRTNQQGGVDKYTPQQLLELAEQITTSCNSNTITHEESRRICQSLCMDRMCCFEDDKYGCKEEEICAVYIGCESLFWSEAFVAKDDFFATNLLQLADEIIGYCDEYLIDPQSADGKECVKRCKDHMCCFENFNGRNNCKQDELTCQLYEGCEMLVGIQELEDASLLDESA